MTDRLEQIKALSVQECAEHVWGVDMYCSKCRELWLIRELEQSRNERDQYKRQAEVERAEVERLKKQCYYAGSEE